MKKTNDDAEGRRKSYVETYPIRGGIQRWSNEANPVIILKRSVSKTGMVRFKKGVFVLSLNFVEDIETIRSMVESSP